MKIFFFFIFFFLNFITSYSQEPIHFLDMDSLLNNSNYGKKIITKLSKINDQNIIEIESYEKNLKNLQDEINKMKNVASKDELNLKIKNLEKEVTNYRDKKKKIISNYNQTKNKELEEFFKIVTPFIESYMEINSINIIMDKKNIFIANRNYDITFSLIEFLNEKIE